MQASQKSSVPSYCETIANFMQYSKFNCEGSAAAQSGLEAEERCCVCRRAERQIAVLAESARLAVMPDRPGRTISQTAALDTLSSALPKHLT